MNLGLVGRNAIFNVARLGAGFFLIATLPFLVRRLDPEQFNYWSVLLQVPSYIALLGAGVAVAVVRLVAEAEPDTRTVVVRETVAVNRWLVAAGVAATAGLAVALPLLVGDLGGDALRSAHVSVALIGAGACVALYCGPYLSFHNGIQDNAASSLGVVATRAMGAVGLVALSSAGISVMSAVLGATLAAGGAWQLLLYRRRAPTDSTTTYELRASVRREVRGYVATYFVWSVVSLAASGLDVVVVGTLDFTRVGAYASAASVLAVLVGTQSAVMSSFLPDLSRASDARVSSTLISVATEVAGLMSWGALALALVAGRRAMELVFGDDVGGDAYPVLLILLIARLVLSLVWPYVLGTLAAGSHARVRATPIAEGVVNFVVSVLLVWRVGAIGAAIGTLVGAGVATALHLIVNVPRTPEVGFSPVVWAVSGIVRPCSTLAPLLLLAGVAPFVPDVVAWSLSPAALALTWFVSGADARRRFAASSV